MIKITSRAHLRSLANEAGRQGEFYTNRRCDDLAIVWSEIEALTYAALQQNRNILIRLEEGSKNPIPIKACE